MGIKRDGMGRFVPGNRSNIKGEFKRGACAYRHPKGYRASPKTEFRKGHIPFNFTGIGVPRLQKHRRDGVIVVTTINKKRRNKCRGSEYLTKQTTSFARFVFGLENIPEGHVIYHKDRDPLNNETANLECISRGELVKRNRGL